MFQELRRKAASVNTIRELQLPVRVVADEPVESDPFAGGGEKLQKLSNRAHAVPYQAVPADPETAAAYEETLKRFPEDGIYRLPGGQYVHKRGDRIWFSTWEGDEGKQLYRTTTVSRDPITGKVLVYREEFRGIHPGHDPTVHGDQRDAAKKGGIAHKTLTKMCSGKVLRVE